MTALLYVLVAVLALALSVEAYLDDRDDPARQAFLALSASIALAYVGFSLSLLPTLDGFRVLYLLAGSAVAPTALWTFDRTFFREDLSPTPGMRLVYVATPIVATLAALLHVLLADELLRPSVPGIVAGVFALYGLTLALRRLWQAQEASHLRIDRGRLRWLFAVVAAAVVLTALEQVGRILVPPIDPHALSLSSRGVALQGPLPPFSTIFAGLAVYFLYHSVVMSRLLDVTELFSRLTTVLLSAVALVLVDGLTFLWVDTFTVYPFHSTFQIFLASVLFLAAYDPLRSRIAWVANRLFDRRSHQLTDALRELDRQLPTVIDQQVLADALLDALHRSGRVPVCSVYVWDARHDAFVCAGSRGAPDHAPLRVVAARPFGDRFERGAPWYLRSTVQRRALHDPRQAEVLALMDSMNADLTVPLVSGRTVLGWLHVRDEPWSDGYSAEEILQLQKVATRAGTVLANVHGFEAIEEQKRLAVLGAMSAGLAHEIRNPLAGVKGAAQFLQGEQGVSGEAWEMLGVIIHETDRLNVVVSEFLDYARPFELSRIPEDLDQVVIRALATLRAQGLPPGVELHEDLAPDLPLVRLDPTRMGQVTLNLLHNAVQAMPGGGRLTVHTRRARDRTGRAVVELQVQDTGAGIAPQELEKLFVPFFTTKPQGTGLGLAICQRIVQAHGGEIDVMSVVGEGSTFSVRLPLDEER